MPFCRNNYLICISLLVISAIQLIEVAAESRCLTHQIHPKLSDVPPAIFRGVNHNDKSHHANDSISTENRALKLMSRGGDNSPVALAVRTGILLAFASGYTNGFCLSGLLGIKQPVAAVTGTYTISALGVASGNFNQAFFQLRVLGSYIFGNMISGFLTPEPIPFVVQSSYCPTFLIASLFLIASSLIAGGNGEERRAFLYLAAVANGIQNSITSTHTQNLVRSTHYSGMSSDIGTYMGQILRGNGQNKERLGVFIRLCLSFWIGGFAAFHGTSAFQSSSLYIPAAIYFLLGIHLFFSSKE